MLNEEEVDKLIELMQSDFVLLKKEARKTYARKATNGELSKEQVERIEKEVDGE